MWLLPLPFSVQALECFAVQAQWWTAVLKGTWCAGNFVVLAVSVDLV